MLQQGVTDLESDEEGNGEVVDTETLGLALVNQHEQSSTT